MSNPAGLMVQNASGVHDVAFPSGVTPAWQGPLVDVEGNVFFVVDLASGDAGAPTEQVWKWNPATGSAAQMPGVGEPYGSRVNLSFVDRGQIIWVLASTGDVYATEISTGTAHQLDTANGKFGSLIGVDAKNLYGAASNCPDSACPFTVWGTPRDGGTAFVAYQTTASYWTSALQADDTGLYWVDLATPGFYRAPLMKGAPAQLVYLLPDFVGTVIPSQFSMDECNLYWIIANGTPNAKQDLMAVPK
jgi:hypothetical protein